MNQAQQSAKKSDAPATQQKQNDAAAALDRAAQQMAQRTQTSETPKPNADAPRQAAQQLAREQRDLAKQTQQAQADAARKPGEAGKQQLQNAMEQIARQQQQLNDQASKLPANGAKRRWSRPARR